MSNYKLVMLALTGRRGPFHCLLPSVGHDSGHNIMNNTNEAATNREDEIPNQVGWREFVSIILNINPNNENPMSIARQSLATIIYLI